MAKKWTVGVLRDVITREHACVRFPTCQWAFLSGPTQTSIAHSSIDAALTFQNDWTCGAAMCVCFIMITSHILRAQQHDYIK
jgi:hypothetical protein